jgi:undecaprenyl-phosphate 4-deoxy-4-formamido-L-arabinose transferase
VASVSAVVPVYNSEQTLDALVGRLEAALAPLFSDFEIVLVDDGSRDGSWTAVERLATEHELVRGIGLARNYGQHNALLAGIRAARHELVLTLDDDLQNPPEEVGKLLTRLGEGFDVVYGSPTRAEHSLRRRLASRVTKFVLRDAIGPSVARHIGPFRLFRTSLRDAFAGYAAPHVSVDVLLSWGTARFGVVDVAHSPRGIGESNYTFRRLARHMVTMVTGFSTWPLRLASVMGFALTLFGAGLLAYLTARYITIGRGVPGFYFLASTVSVFAGAQLFALGIFGEYLARIHIRLMDRPPYAVREEIGTDALRPVA